MLRRPNSRILLAWARSRGWINGRKCSPLHWVLGFCRWRMAWLHYHRWQPNCRKLYSNLERLERSRRK